MTIEYSSKYVFTDDLGNEYVVTKKARRLPTLYRIESKAVKELKTKTEDTIRFKSVSYTQHDL